MTTTPNGMRVWMLSGLLLASLSLTACGKSDQTASAPPAEVDALITEDMKIGTGAEAQPLSALAMHYTGWLYDPAQPEGKGAEFDSSHKRNRPFETLLGMGRVIKGWDEGIVGMKVGGQRRLIIPADMAYGERGFGDAIPPNSTLVFDVELLAVEQVEKIDHVFGEGDEANRGQRVSVHYTGWLFDESALANKGQKFDSSLDRDAPFEFILGAGRVISGWELGVQGMKVGGKRTLIIPPSMAYGPRGRPGIPPNSTLVFDIELLELQGNPL